MANLREHLVYDRRARVLLPRPVVTLDHLADLRRLARDVETGERDDEPEDVRPEGRVEESELLELVGHFVPQAALERGEW